MNRISLKSLIVTGVAVGAVVLASYAVFGLAVKMNEVTLQPPAGSVTEKGEKVPDETVPPLTPLPIPIPQAVTQNDPTVSESTLGLKIFDKDIPLAGTPLLLTEGGEVLLPIRRIGEGMGYSVKWDDTLKAAVLEKNTESITVRRDSREYAWGSTPRLLSRKPVMFQNRLYVPADFITDNAGLQLERTATTLSVSAAAPEDKQVTTGEIIQVKAYSNGLGLTVKNKEGADVQLYVTDRTAVTHYTSGEKLGQDSLKAGVRAIFTYTRMKGAEAASYNLLTSVEIVAESAAELPVQTN